MGDPARLILGDCREVLPTLEADSFDSSVTDPPYELGFMGKAWDRTGVAVDPATWRAVLRVLKPGGYLLAFGGTRTFHRLMSAVEDAGFEIRDSVAELFDNNPLADAFLASLTPDQRDLMDRAFPGDGLMAWAFGTGFPKGKGCLKPAYETIVLARKPGPRVLPLGIDECRVGSGEDRAKGGLAKIPSAFQAKGNQQSRPVGGRYPANLLHDGSPEVLGAFAASGESTSSDRPRRNTAAAHNRTSSMGKSSGDWTTGGYSDTGTAARFFWSPKASRKERGEANTHPTVKPLALVEYLVRLVTPPGGLTLDPFVGSGTTLLACLNTGRNGVGVERDAGNRDIAEARIAAAGSALPLLAGAR